MTNHPNRPKVGRPAMAAEDKKQKMTFWLSPDVAAALRAASESQSNLVDRAVRAALID